MSKTTTEKFSSMSISGEEKAIESQPKRLNPVFKRELDSPTKSLQQFDQDKVVERGNPVFGQRRSSSLCILALKASAALAKSQKASSSLSSMISLPGVPPVQGVNDVQQVQLHRQKSKKQKQEKISASSNSRLQSEEDLILSLHRKQEFQSMNSAKLKQEEDILSNIRKREMIDKLNKAGGDNKRDKEVKKKIQVYTVFEKSHSKCLICQFWHFPSTSLVTLFDYKFSGFQNLTKFLIFSKCILLNKTFLDFQTLWIQENQQNYGIASGLLKTRNLLVAPITSFEEHDNKQEDNLIPPGMKPTSDHPNERRIVRWLKSATIQSAPELVVQAETRFSQSPFVQECFQWHNQLRRRHLAPDLVLDAPVSTGRPNKFYNIMAE